MKEDTDIGRIYQITFILKEITTVVCLNASTCFELRAVISISISRQVAQKSIFLREIVK